MFMKVLEKEVGQECICEFIDSVSEAFCYSCGKVVKKDKYMRCFCPTCRSDDLMRYVRGVGCEYGYGWIIEHFIKVNINPVCCEDLYEEFLYDLYGDSIEICGCNFDPVKILKYQDRVSYEFGFSDWVFSELDNEILIEVDEKYFYFEDVVDYIKNFTKIRDGQHERI